jgi:Cu/Ag efflux pump CusA
LFARAPLGHGESPPIRWVGRHYNTLLSRLLRTPRPALLALAVIALAGLVVVPQLRPSPLPVFKETDFLVDLEAPAGTSLPEMDRITAQASRELRSIPGVRNVGAHVGRAITGDQVANTNSSELWISLDLKADYDQTVASIRRVIQSYPGIDSDVKTYAQARFREVQTGADEPVVVRVYGAELSVLRQKAEEVTRALSGVRGVTNLHAELPTQEPTVQVEVNLEAAKAAGVKPGDVRRAAAVLLSGVVAGSLFEEQKVFDVVVWGTPGTRQNLSAIRDLLIDTPSGGQVRLGDLAKVDVKPSPNVIEREAVSRRIDVTANVQGRDRNAALAEVRQRLKNVDFPLEYHYELVGNYAERQAVQQRLLLVGQAAFGSWRMAAVSFLSLPVALVGGAVAVLIDGGSVELGSLVGFLTILGITVRNGVLLIKRYQQLQRDEGETFGRDLVLRGARERLAPILLTATATGLFFLPFAFLGDLPGHEIVNPMGGVILGGLVTSTILNLFLIPALYLRFGHREADFEDLDLRELWEFQPPDGDSRAAVMANAQMVGSEVGAGAPEVRPQ